MESSILLNSLVPPIVRFGGQELLGIAALVAAFVPLAVLLKARWTPLPRCSARVPSLRVVGAVKSRPA